MKRIPIVGFSKKFKRIKLPAQKAPSRFISGSERELAAKSARKVLGEAPEYMGMSQRAISDMAAESLALRTAEKKFFRALPKELRRSRFITARGIKTLRSKGQLPKKAYSISRGKQWIKGTGSTKLKVFRAKQKGAMKAYGIATKKSDTVFERTHTKFTGQSKASPFKTFSRKAPKRFVSKEQKKTWGF